MATKKITKKPDKSVTGLGAPTRGSGNHTMTANWKVPSSMTKDSSESRATDLVVDWSFNIGGVNKKLTKEYGASRTTSSVNLNNLKIGSKTYTRSSFYPNGRKGHRKKLRSVSVSVSGKNSKGEGKAVTQTRRFEKPRKPTISAISLSTEEQTRGRCTATIRTNAGTDYHERFDTRYRITVTGRNGKTFVAQSDASESTEFSRFYDAGSYQSLASEYIKIVFTAWARGYAGDSKKATKTFYISRPWKPVIKSYKVTQLAAEDRLTVYIDTKQSKTHPVDAVKLEVLRNTTYTKASDIPEGADWEDTGISDNGNCTALTMPVGQLPDRGKTTWVRVKSYHADEAILYNYSEYKRLTKLETPAAETVNEPIKVLSVTSGADGQSAVVQLGWNQSGTDDATGTELSWSDEEDTWKSTKDPDSYEFTWSDGSFTYGGVTYRDSANIVIKGLTEGQKYYIRARRYWDEETTSYGKYSNQETVITNERPAGVSANCESYITAGEPLSVYWTYSGNGVQTSWKITDSYGHTVAEGEGSRGATQISAERLAELAVDNTISFVVQVSTGSGYEPEAYSAENAKTVIIRERPTLEITAPTVLTEQPFEFTATSDKECDLVVIVTAQGTTGQYPEGIKTQPNGDTIHSDVYSPDWVEGEATVTLPSDLDFWDLGGYVLSVVAIDRETGLTSEEQIPHSFTVNWENQAVDPDSAITLIPLDYRTDSGEHVQAVQINLTPPANCNEDDVYDIYRMDGGNAHLIGRDFPLTHTVIDRYAPFGDENEELYYRIALRTVDGDVEFADKEYELYSEALRLDWAGGTLELPYGVSIGDSYSKDVEFRHHMDGSVDGYWNRNIERKGSYSSSVIKLIQPEEINLARQLARYAGAVFVRTPNGSAYTADVQVTDLSVKNKAVTLIAVDATEVGMTEEFMLPTPFEKEEE